ncbi:MAG: histidinol-phosphate transaminase [Rhodobacteraceae bacterium]|nr:histidinol-phosphate transaminase [Paracoccaceae bacterium]
MPASVIARPGLADIQPYVAGEAKIEGRDQIRKLSSNENPFGPGPAARAALENLLDGLGCYPSRDHAQLRQAIAEEHGFDPDRIVCGAGSDEILTLIAQVFSGPGKEVIHTRHAFLMYPLIARSVGATPVEVMEADRTADVETILRACSEHTSLVYLANPANPTGTMLGSDELDHLARALPGSVILVLDGAYAEFSDMPDYARSLAESCGNVVITRTFSKIHGLASLRVGYGYGSAEIMRILDRIRAPFNVSGPGLAAAAAAVRDREFVDNCRAHNSACRSWLRERLLRAGVGVDESQANFLLARFAGESEALACDAWLRNDGILVRRMGDYKLPECLRISIGDRAACRAVADSVAGFMAR